MRSYVAVEEVMLGFGFLVPRFLNGCDFWAVLPAPMQGPWKQRPDLNKPNPPTR